MSSTYCNLHVHIVFATQGRAPIIQSSWRNELHAYIGGILKGQDVFPREIGGVSDHIHLLVDLKTKQNVADLVRTVKINASRWVQQQHDSRFGWQDGYGAFSVSHSQLETVRTYIQNQERHHRQLTSADELRQLLAENGVKVDERYFE